jgi:cyclomaltodextrin glucanotransferase
VIARSPALLAFLAALFAPPPARAGNVDKWFAHTDANPAALPDKHIGNEVFYEIFVDRFADGNPDNDCLDGGRYCDPSRQDFYKFWGGDLRGVIDHLPYLKQLGVTRLWLTPIFQNDMVEVARHRFGKDVLITAYHGYWTRDWFRLSPNFTDAGVHDYAILNELVAKAAPEMKVLLDTVANHSSPADATAESVAWLDGAEPLGQDGGAARSHLGAVFRDGAYVASWTEDLNPPASQTHAHFHHYGPITDYTDPFQLQNYQVDGLTDIDQTDPVLHDYLRDAHAFWMEKVPGLAGYRMDTVRHVPVDYWQSFDQDFFGRFPDKQVVGEWFGAGPGDAAAAAAYKTTHFTLFDFEFRQALADVFLGGQPITRLEQVWSEDPQLIDARSLVTFLDNHDLPRLRGQGLSKGRLRQALALLFAARGVPCVFYGLEQDLYTPNDPGDPFNRPMMTSFDTSGDLFQLVAKLAKLRRDNLALRNGRTHVVHESDKIIAFERVDGDRRVFFATSVNAVSADSFDIVNLTLPDGTYNDVLSGRAYAVHGGVVHVDLNDGDVILLSAPAT